MRGLLRHQRGRRHAGLGVGFQQDQARPGAGIVVAEIGARHAAAAQGVMRLERQIHAVAGNGCGNIRREDMARTAGRVFGFIIIEFQIGDDLRHAQGPVAHHRDGEFAPGHEFFHHHLVRQIPLIAAQRGGRAIVAGAYNKDAHAGAFVDRLDHIGRLHQVPFRDLAAVGHDGFHHRQASRAIDVLGSLLVHGKRGGEHAGMGVRQPHQFQQPLHRAVLAESPMQGIKYSVWLGLI